MAITGLDAIAWELYETGTTYAEVASYANQHDISVEDAMIGLYLQ